ncbi:MAG: Rnase Y domain-containing protein, partial [Spirochaetales bacterium]
MSVLLCILLCLVSIGLGWLLRWLYGRLKLTSIEQKAIRLNQEAIRDAEAKSREILLEGRDKLLKEQLQQEREDRERRAEVQRYERRLQQKEENLDKIRAGLDSVKAQQQDKEAKLAARENQIAESEKHWNAELERVSKMTGEEAKALLIERMETEAKRDGQTMINKIEQEAQVKADKTAREIIVSTIQRLATEVSNEITVSSVSLPSDEMKGRIIGREGRNIRAL